MLPHGVAHYDHVGLVSPPPLEPLPGAGEIPEALGSLTALQQLALQKNSLSGE